MSRQASVEQLYEGLTVLARRSRELGGELHPGLSVVEYGLLTFIAADAGTRAADIATSYGLDKSTVSRQVDQLVAAGWVVRGGDEGAGRRGQVLALTKAGQRVLRDAADMVHAALVERLEHWSDRDIVAFARLVAKFNERPVSDL